HRRLDSHLRAGSLEALDVVAKAEERTVGCRDDVEHDVALGDHRIKDRDPGVLEGHVLAFKEGNALTRHGGHLQLGSIRGERRSCRHRASSRDGSCAGGHLAPGYGPPTRFRGETRTVSTRASRPFAVGPTGFGPAVDILAQRFGDRLTVARGIRSQHANITTWHPVEIPDAVLFPESTEEVAETLRICADHRMPVIPFGVGTSLEGHVNAPFGGLSIDMGRMRSILAV